MQACETNEKPSAMLVRQMIRILVDAVMVATKHSPRKKDMEYLAIQITSKYPLSFKDTIGGIVCGSGHDTLTRALYKQANYIMRKNFVMSGEKKMSSKNKKRKIFYDCLRESWEPKASLAEEIMSQKTALQIRIPILL